MLQGYYLELIDGVMDNAAASTQIKTYIYFSVPILIVLFFEPLPI